ncbi:hypothetical protein R8510_05386 [Ralstonia chuxiongensis]|nr:hypothetical protein R8510_05386 [Ralstonia chuxiongensis]
MPQLCDDHETLVDPHEIEMIDKYLVVDTQTYLHYGGIRGQKIDGNQSVFALLPGTLGRFAVSNDFTVVRDRHGSEDAIASIEQATALMEYLVKLGQITLV